LLIDRLAKCDCCPRQCRVNRLQGEVGFCGIGGSARVAYSGLHFGEEPPISGTRGSGAVFFAGCNLRCVFCQNHQISQEFRKLEPRVVSTDQLAGDMLRLEAEGAHNINFVSPSHVVVQMAEAIRLARRRGLAVPIVYNSNGYDSVDALRQIRGLVDVYLPDIKYLDNELGHRLSGVDDYAEVVPGVLREMLDQVGHLTVDEEGVAVRGLLVRHLVLPGHLENARRCLSFLAGLSPGIPVSVMSQYSPQYRAGEYPDIDRYLTQEEYDQVIDWALDLGLENAFVQEIASQEGWLPDFACERPFAAPPGVRTGIAGPPNSRAGAGEP
jgi:putative pyruvate formate lyase activating enzyme